MLASNNQKPGRHPRSTPTANSSLHHNCRSGVCSRRVAVVGGLLLAACSSTPLVANALSTSSAFTPSLRSFHGAAQQPKQHPNLVVRPTRNWRSSPSFARFYASPTMRPARDRDDDDDVEWLDTTTTSNSKNDPAHSMAPVSQFWKRLQKRSSIPSSVGLLLLSAALALVVVPGTAMAANAIAASSSSSSSWTTISAAWASSIAETGFYQAFSLVFVSELGDKTFFIAGLLAMKTSRWISAVGSIGALTVMTLISVAIGQIFHVVPAGLGDGIPIDDICAALAFLFFGLKTLKEAFDMDDGNTSSDGDDDTNGAKNGMDGELAEAEETVNENQNNFLNKNTLGQIASVFALVFAAEFGDRSFLSTIALSAAQKPLAVAGGAIAAHALATGVAVTGGSVVAKYLSEKVIGLIGGSLFLIFAVTTILGIF